MPPDKEAVRASIRHAFAEVPLPARIEDMRLARHTGDDSYEMAADLLGRRWTEITIEALFRHRESLAALSPAAYRAYLPAYLDASLASDDPLDRHGPDIRHYLLATLKHWPHHPNDRAAETRERLSALSPAQRAAVAEVLGYLAATWHAEDAVAVLREW